MELLQQLQAIAGLVALIILYTGLVKNKNSKRLMEAPEPAGGLPVIGHFHLLRGKKPQHRLLSDMADKYGPVFTLQLGKHRTIVVSDQKVAKECFTRNDRVLASRPKIAVGKYLAYENAMLGFASYGPYWREIRKIVTNLLSSRHFEMLEHALAEEIDSFIKEFHELYVKNERKPITLDIDQLLGNMSMNLIVRNVFGKRCIGKIGGDSEEDREAHNWRTALRRFLKLFGTNVPGDFFPFLQWADLGGHVREMKRTTKELDSILTKWVEEHRHKRHSGGQSDGDHYLIDVLLSTLKDSQLSDFDTDTIIKATCLNLIFGATDSTASTLIWAISLLLNNRHALEKAQAEVDLHVGKERKVDESDIKNLVYLQAIIKETLRLYPSGPLLAPHEATEDCQIGDFHVQASTRILVNVWKIQRDPNIWSEPLEFRPERFLTNHIDINLGRQNFDIFPFGNGRRQCPGMDFALTSMPLTLARLLHEFSLETPSNKVVDMTEALGINLPRASPLKVVLTPRLHFNLQE